VEILLDYVKYLELWFKLMGKIVWVLNKLMFINHIPVSLHKYKVKKYMVKNLYY